MGLTFLVFDRRRKYASIIGDILDITGHKLLVALNEEKVKELLDKVPVDIILLELEDIDVWLDNLERSNYAKPIFFLQDYQQVEELMKCGFSEKNFAVLPFNPLDLLSNAVFISKDMSQIVSKGFINTLLDVLRHKLSVNLVIDNKCTVSIKNGTIRGYTCSDEQLISAVSSVEPSVELSSYQEGLIVQQTIKSNADLFRILTKKKYAYEEEKVQVTLPSIDEEAYTRPIEFIEGIFWIGSLHENDVLQTNTFLRLYKKGSIEIPILINAGSKKEYTDIKNRIEQVIGSVDNLKAIIVMGIHSDDYINAYNFMQVNPRLYIITTLPIARELNELDIPMTRIRLIEYLESGTLRLATGDALRFIHTPFCPDKGSFVIYEESTGALFTGHLFSSYASDKNLSPNAEIDTESLEIFHVVNMPSNKAIEDAIKTIKDLNVKTILPKYGNVIWNPAKAISALESVKVGVDALGTKNGNIILVLKDFIRSCRFWLNDKEFASFLQVISRYIYVSDDLNEVEVYVDAEFLPSILLTSLMSLGVKGEFVLNSLKLLYSKGLLNFTI